jgi:hypothetical protein
MRVQEPAKEIPVDLSPLSSNELLKVIKTIQEIHAERAGLRVAFGTQSRSSFELAPIETIFDQVNDIRNRLIADERAHNEGMER